MPKRSKSSKRTKRTKRIKNSPKCVGKERNWKTWNSNSKKPGTNKRRSNLKKKCGSKCFGDAKNLKYPLCQSNCSFDRGALLSAKILGTHHGHYDVVRKASRHLKSCNKNKSKRRNYGRKR